LKTDAAKFSLFIILDLQNARYRDRIGYFSPKTSYGTFTFPEYLKPCVYGVKTPKQEGCATLDTA